ncbi:MAG: hypothetical protein HZB38_07130 [Planctomycetes bacterium]|nr:hypothetical protein [Planctomycetota bacterium]
MQARRRRNRILIAALSVGGLPFVMEGCDPTVRDTVLNGVQGASQTLIGTFVDAFFESLNANQDDPNSPSTL